MPLSRQSNNIWKAKNPGQVLVERQIDFAHSQTTLKDAYIDEDCFLHLRRGADGLRDFWDRRAELIVVDLLSKTNITI